MERNSPGFRDTDFTHAQAPKSAIDRQTNGDADGARVAHTLTACCRCRSRKTRCDPAIPRCGPCEKNNALCEYYDTSKAKKIPRSYVVHLQRKVQALEEELYALSQHETESPDAETMARSAGYVRFSENDQGKYLGPSSGIAITRLVMEIAKQNTCTKTIKDIVSDTKAREIKDRFAKEQGKPTSKTYPVISDVAAPDLPTRGLTDNLVDNFNRKAQYMWPTLHEPSFRKVVDNVYNGSTYPHDHFTLRMVIAISLQKIGTQWAGLADAFYLAALQYLEDAVKPMNLGTLQCFALIAQYSLLTPTRTAAYWVVGLAARLCQELGITEEATITSPNGFSTRPDAIEIDMRRRLFWVITSMEFGLAHSLGRPSAFGTTHDHIDVEFFKPVDDACITSSGVIPGSPLSLKKRICIHFFKMRLLQAEIRRKLYLKKRLEPTSDQDQWFQEIMAKLDHWRHSGPKYDEGSGLSDKWFQGRLNTMIVFLFRPSPQIPKPSAYAARQCFEASLFNIDMQREQIATSSVDLTWIFTQSLFMALNAVLWAISYPEIRREYPKEKVEDHIDVAQEAISLASERWPGVESALGLYQNLIAACLKAYDTGSEAPYGTDSSSSKDSPASLQDALTPPPFAAPTITSVPQKELKFHPLPTAYPTQETSPDPSNYHFHNPQSNAMPRNPAYDYDLTSYKNPLTGFPSLPPILHSSSTSMNAFGQHGDFLGEQYSQYLHAPYIPQQPLRTLNQEEQVELMKNLENTNIDWS